MIKLNRRALILIMGALALLAFGIATVYYGMENKKVDPRVVEARKMYDRFDNYASASDYKSVFALLDSVTDVYESIPHYANSYELAVLDNNRGAAYLTMAISDSTQSYSFDGVNLFSKDSLLQLSEMYLEKAIDSYKKWLEVYEGKDIIAIESMVKRDFFNGLSENGEQKRNDYFRNRVEEIELAKLENKRRLSVALTNLGIVHRHKEQYKQAILLYEQALELWDQNLAAKNNLNILLGKPIEKRNFIQKMFPPEKDQE
jgi:tetratricopeptide (TPR) repeat protein